MSARISRRHPRRVQGHAEAKPEPLAQTGWRLRWPAPVDPGARRPRAHRLRPAGDHRPESILPGDETSPPEQLQTVTQVAFEVDPVSGTVRLGEAVPPSRADGLRPALLGSEHVTVTVTC